MLHSNTYQHTHTYKLNVQKASQTKRQHAVVM